MKHIITLFSFLLLILSLFSCSIKQEATVHHDGSGSVDFNFEVQEFFMESLMEMASFGDDTELFESGAFFDVEKTKASFAEKETVTLTSISSPEPTVMKGTFTFDNIQEVFETEAQLTSTEALTFNQNGESHTLTVHLDRENFSQIASFSPALENPLFQMFGPQENDQTSPEEYFEMIEFAFGEPSASGLKTSFVELTVTVEGQLISQRGGKQVDENTVLFRIPLVDILLLEKPLDYSITFR